MDIGERNWEGGMNWEIRFDKYNTMYRIESQPEPEVQHRELSSVLCDDADVWVQWG